MARHIISLELSAESERAIQRAVGNLEVSGVVYEIAVAAIMDLVARGQRGLVADALVATGEIEIGRAELPVGSLDFGISERVA